MQRALSYAEADYARMGLRDNLQRLRWEAIAKASTNSTDAATAHADWWKDAQRRPPGEVVVYDGLPVTEAMDRQRRDFFAVTRGQGATNAAPPVSPPPQSSH
jgi:hypothetical protein